jgi:hypothetical protein
VSLTLATLRVELAYQIQTTIRLPVPIGDANVPVLSELEFAVSLFSLSWTNVTTDDPEVVVTITPCEGNETLFDVSYATTVYVYVVADVRPESL